MNSFETIVLFDGVCNLCNRSVQFIIKRDKKKLFRFAPLQGKNGQQLLQQYGLPAEELHSFVLIDSGNVYTKSTGILKLLKKLGRGWQLFYVFIIQEFK